MNRRAEQRAHFDTATRLTLLEDDVDSIEKTGARLATSLNRVMVAIVGASLSLVVASLLLAADIARGH